jgi:hypothetical protein
MPRKSSPSDRDSAKHDGPIKPGSLLFEMLQMVAQAIARNLHREQEGDSVEGQSPSRTDAGTSKTLEDCQKDGDERGIFIDGDTGRGIKP